MTSINDINATSVKVITGCIMAVLLTVYYAVSSYAGHTIEPVVFGEMCVFAATFSGIAYASQRMKRTTDYQYVAAQSAAQSTAYPEDPAPPVVVDLAPAARTAPLPPISPVVESRGTRSRRGR